MSVRCDFTAEDVVFLIKRNWFWDITDLHDLMWQLPEDVFQKVSARKHEFHPEIQYFFNDYYYHPSIKEYTDKQWDIDQREITELRDKQVREFKKRFVAPPRPRESLDDLCDSLSASILTTKPALEDMIRQASKKRGYVPPNQRKNETYDDDPMIRETRKKLKNLENEYEGCKKRIEALEKGWFDLKCIDAVVLNAGRLSEE